MSEDNVQFTSWPPPIRKWEMEDWLLENGRPWWEVHLSWASTILGEARKSLPYNRREAVDQLWHRYCAFLYEASQIPSGRGFQTIEFGKINRQLRAAIERLSKSSRPAQQMNMRRDANPRPARQSPYS